MKGHVRERGGGWAYVVDLEGQRAQRCEECNARHWVERERPIDRCPKDACVGTMKDPAVERRQVWKSGFTTKGAAEKAMRNYLVELDQGADPFPADTDLRTWSAKWQATEAFTTLRPRTRSRYAQVFADYWLAELGDMEVGKIRPRHVRTVLDAMAAGGSSARSVTEAKAILSSCLARAVDVGLVDVNACAGVRTKGGRRRQLVVPDQDQAKALLAAVEGTTWEVPLALASYTGMRRSEVLGLRWCDVDIEGRSISVRQGLHRIRENGTSRLDFLPTKTETSERTFMIGATLVDRLKAHRRAQTERRLALGVAWVDHDLICDRGDGGPLDPDSFSSGFKTAVTKAKLPKAIRLHDVRHSVATTLLREGVDPKIVSAMLGHSTVAFTQDQYQHVLKSMTSAAADALDQALGG